MKLKAAIIADDLTGALDTGTPFLFAGLSVAVAVEPEATEEALRTGADIVVVNTASRSLDAKCAAAKATEAAERLVAARPGVVMKKIDSRLKGNVAAETFAVAGVLGHSGIVVAPAIPDQQRYTRQGHVIGRGVERPLAIAPLFAGHRGTVTVADAESDGDMDMVVDGYDWRHFLAVGARGLGVALAGRLGRDRPRHVPFEPATRTLFAFGSRDPITLGQMERLEASGLLNSVVNAPAGALAEKRGLVLPALLRCTGEITGEGGPVAERFAIGVRSVIDDTRPEMIMVGGGDTALAVFKAIGVSVLKPKGEVEPGIPWFQITDHKGRTMRCAVKSGGFGDAESLLKLIPRNQAA